LFRDNSIAVCLRINDYFTLCQALTEVAPVEADTIAVLDAEPVPEEPAVSSVRDRTELEKQGVICNRAACPQLCMSMTSVFAPFYSLPGKHFL
jgi:hypothetical protein